MYQPGGNYRQNIYGNQYNNNQNNANMSYVRKNQVHENQKNTSNQKYGDLEIQTFFDEGKGQTISANDLNLKNNLEKITVQYMAIFDNINNMANKFSGGNNDIYKFNNIKKEFQDIDSYSGTEYGKFIGELFDISKDNQILNYDYDRFKKNPKECEAKLKKCISDCKYDVILSVNKHKSQEDINRIQKYIKSKTSKNTNTNSNSNSNKNKYENTNNYEQQSKNREEFNFGNSIYGNNKNNNQQTFNFGNSIYSNPNNNKYENPNEVGNDDYYGNRGNYGNNYNPNQYESNYNQNRKITVKLVYQNRDKKYEYSANEKGELLYYAAYELKDGDPKIYDKRGKNWTYDKIKNLEIGKIFENVEPILDIY